MTHVETNLPCVALGRESSRKRVFVVIVCLYKTRLLLLYYVKKQTTRRLLYNMRILSQDFLFVFVSVKTYDVNNTRDKGDVDS